MIGTLDIKRQLGSVFTLESSGVPKEVILIVGACRSVPYLNYLDRYNRSSGLPFRIHFIDPFNYNWDGNEPESKVDMEAAINALETDARMLAVLSSTTIFIHEYYANYGMFNCAWGAAKNIYQFGMSPRLDICIPNFNDVAVLGQPRETGLRELEKFYAICRQTSFPEMEKHFRDNWQSTRFFWTPNHVSKNFTLYLFGLMNSKFLHLPLHAGFWIVAAEEDLFAEPHMEVTWADRDNFGIQW